MKVKHILLFVSVVLLDQLSKWLLDINKMCIRDSVQIVLQEPFLFSKTIYENIHVASEKASHSDVHKAASMASIHKDIEQFDEGYETMVAVSYTHLKLYIPWLGIGITIFVLFLLLILIMFFSIKRSEQENIIETIRQESI